MGELNNKPLKVCFINDDVMGGKSTCAYKPTTSPDGAKSNAFRGFVSEGNNGGFSSVRFDTSAQSDFSSASGMMIKAKSENHAHAEYFQFFVRDEKCNKYMATNWKTTFTAKEEGTYVAFKDLVLESFGRPLAESQSWSIDLKNIVEMGFYAKKPDIVGYFCLHVYDLALSNKPK